MRLILHTAPGLDQILWREVRSLDPDAANEGSRLAGGRNSMLLVESDEPESLLRSRIAEDAYALLAQNGQIELGRKGLDQLAEIARTTPEWDDALRLHAEVTGGRGRRGVSTYRVIARAEGERGYKRREAGDAVAAGLRGRLGKNWKLVDDNAQVEVWLTLIGPEAIIGMRLTNRTQRHREKQAHIPASLRPSVAAALAFLSAPKPDDIFLDPFCGAGTILVERALKERYKLILGSDMSENALDAARENIGEKHKPLELHVWDATQLPLDDGSISAIASNPPFGEQLGSHEVNERLYPAFIREAHRVLGPGGRIVILSPEFHLLRRELAPPSWTVIGRHHVRVLGKQATIFSALKV